MSKLGPDGSTESVLIRYVLYDYVLVFQNVMEVKNSQFEPKVGLRQQVYPCNETNDLILNLTPEKVTQHSRIVTTTRKGSSTPTK